MTCHSTHHPGCECHEARRDAEIAVLRMANDELAKALAKQACRCAELAARLSFYETPDARGLVCKGTRMIGASYIALAIIAFSAGFVIGAAWAGNYRS